MIESDNAFDLLASPIFCTSNADILYYRIERSGSLSPKELRRFRNPGGRSTDSGRPR